MRPVSLFRSHYR